MSYKVAIFIDFNNMLWDYQNSFKSGTHSQIPERAWQNFNYGIFFLLSVLFKNPIIKFSHVFSHVVYSVSNESKRTKGAMLFSRKMKKIFSEPGFLINELPRKRGTKSESGVDIFLACNMLTGAKKDFYDIAVLASRDNDFIPVVEMVQNKYFKKVIQLAYFNEKSEFPFLRSVCYGNIDLGDLDNEFKIKSK